MVSIIHDDTSIVQESGRWYVHLVLRLSGPYNWGSIKIFLDPSMRAVPSTSSHGTNLGLGAEGLSLGMSTPGTVVHEDRKTLEFSIQSVGVGLRKSTLQKRVFEVEWIHGDLPPKSLELRYQISGPFGTNIRPTRCLIGYRLSTDEDFQTNILAGLNSTDGSEFYFSPEPGKSVFSIDSIAPLLPLFQSTGRTTPWAIAQPKEIEYWQGEHGKTFLVAQLKRRLLENERKPILRLGIGTKGLDLTFERAKQYYTELELQHRLGITIKMIPMDLISSELGSESAGVVSYGEKLGMTIDAGYATDGEGVELKFKDHEIKDIREMYFALWLQASPWMSYKSANKINFNQLESAKLETRKIEIEMLSQVTK